MKSTIKYIISGTLITLLALFGLYMAYKWTLMRVYVGPDQALVVISKYGHDLPADRLTVPPGGAHKGVHEEVRGPGRYFLDPIRYDWKLVDLVHIAAGEPQKWEWLHDGQLKDPRTAPMVGLRSLKEGQPAPPGREVVAENQKGIQREVLTPGTYKINPHREEVTLHPAIVVPPGFVGVATQLVAGDIGLTYSSQLLPAIAQAGPAVAGPIQRGILRDVLQPGIYYLNPRMVKVTIVPVGYDSISLERPLDAKKASTAVHFYSSDGYQVEADFTVVWGRTPANAPQIVATIGNTEQIQQNVIEPAMKAACQNEGARFSAIDLIQGQTREKFQEALDKSLNAQVENRHVFILLALIRNISIKDATGQDATEGLLATIQRANIEIEKELTNKQKTETATVAANLEQARKLIDVAREMVAAETNVRVANIMADGNKQAAEIEAQKELTISDIALQMAQLDAQRTRILGGALAQVEQLRNEAEARGAKMLVEALGSPEAYNRYIFARNFEPQELRLIFAGPGTFWTDLKSFQEVGAAKMVQQPAPPAPAPAHPIVQPAPRAPAPR
jgi:hypothetical protein